METKELYIFADNDIFKVLEINGAFIQVLDKTGWGNSIPLSRVERFCNEQGNHIDFKLTTNTK